MIASYVGGVLAKSNSAIDIGTFGWYKREIRGSHKSLILLTLSSLGDNPFRGTRLGKQPSRSLIMKAQWWAHKGSNLGPLPCEGNFPTFCMCRMVRMSNK
jgi:hypothetical protein